MMDLGNVGRNTAAGSWERGEHHKKVPRLGRSTSWMLYRHMQSYANFIKVRIDAWVLEGSLAGEPEPAGRLPREAVNAQPWKGEIWTGMQIKDAMGGLLDPFVFNSLKMNAVTTPCM